MTVCCRARWSCDVSCLFRIAMYVMDNDPFPPEQALAPLLCQQCCWKDPDQQNAVRFQVFVDGSYKCVEVSFLSPQGQAMYMAVSLARVVRFSQL